MADFTNDFSWSVSRQGKFDECRRAYYWHYYGSWGGWDRDAGAEVRRAWMLKRMSNLDMWGGSVVHEVVERALHDLRWGRTNTIEELHRRGREQMVRSWRQSLGREWEFDPKHRLNLFEHYYTDKTVDRRSVTIRDRVNTCLENFRRSPSYEALQSLQKADWLAVEELDRLELDGFPVWVKIDCAFRRGEEVVIIDWKTGKPREGDREQLTAYALYATTAWENVGPEDILLRAAYLQTGEEVDYTVSQDDLEDLKERIRGNAAEMRALLADADANTAELDAFPMVEDQRRCKRCSFRELCGFGSL